MHFAAAVGVLTVRGPTFAKNQFDCARGRFCVTVAARKAQGVGLRDGDFLVVRTGVPATATDTSEVSGSGSSIRD